MASNSPTDYKSPIQTMLARSKASGDSMGDRLRASQSARIQNRNNLSRGFEQGVGGIAQSFHGLGALASAVAGDEQGMQESAQQAQEYADLSSRVAPDVTDIRDVNSFGSGVDYALGAAGQMVPSLLAIIGTGGVGGAAVGTTAALARGVGQKVLNKSIQRALTKGTAAGGARVSAVAGGMGLEQGQLGAEMLQDDFNSDMTLRQRAGLALAGGAVAGGLEALPVVNIFNRYGLGRKFGDELRKTVRGDTLNQAAQEGLTGILPDDVTSNQVGSAVSGSLAGGAVASSLAALPVFSIFNRYGLGKQFSKALRKNIGKETLIQAAQEGLTEASQQTIQRATLAFADKNREVLGEEGFWEIVNAAAMGAIGGGVLGGGAATVARGADAVGQRLQRPAEPVQDEAAPAEPGIQVEPLDVEEITLEGLSKQREELYNSMEVGEELRDILNKGEARQREDRVPEAFKEESGVGDKRHSERNLVFQRQEDDSQGNPIKRIGFAKNSKLIQPELDRLNKTLEPDEAERNFREGVREAAEKLFPQADDAKIPENEERRNRYIEQRGGNDVSYQKRSMGELIQEEAYDNFPGDPTGQQNYIAEQAKIQSESRQKGKRMEDVGLEPLDYLNQFDVIEGPRQDRGLGESLALSDREVDRAYGARGEVPSSKTGVEYDRRRIMRKLRRNKDKNLTDENGVIVDPTFNKGLNKNSDILIGEDDVINAKSLTFAMQKKINATQSQKDEKVLPAKAGEWFVEGVGSLLERGVTVNLKELPAETVIYSSGSTNITWGQAQRAMLGKKVVGASGRSPGLDSTPKQPNKVKTDPEKMNVRPERRATLPDEKETKGLPEEDDKAQRPIKRTFPGGPGKRASKGGTVDKLKEGGLEKLNQAETVIQKNQQANDALPAPRAGFIARQLSEATGQNYTREMLQGISSAEALKIINKIKNDTRPDGKKLYQPRKGGQANEELGDPMSPRIHKSTQDNTVKGTLKSSKAQYKKAGEALELLEGAETDASKRLIPTAELRSALNGAGVWIEDDAVYFAGRSPAKPLKSGANPRSDLQARLLQKRRALVGAVKTAREIDRSDKRGRTKSEEDAIIDAAMARQAEIQTQREIGKQYDEMSDGDINASMADLYKRTAEWSKGNDHRKLNNLLKALNRRFGLNARLADITDLDVLMEMDPEAAERLATKGYGQARHKTNVIFINPREGMTAQQILSVLMHEYGHIVKNNLWEKLPQKTREAILADYDKWFAENNADGMTTKELFQNRSAKYMHDLLGSDKTLAELDPKFRKYVNSFDEYFADQTSKYFTSDANAIGVIQKFFKSLADALKSMMGIIKKEGFAADKSVKDLYDMMMGAERIDVKAAANDAITSAIKEVNPTITQEQAEQIARHARALFRKENRDVPMSELAAKAAMIAEHAGDYGSDLNFAFTQIAYNEFLNKAERAQLAKAFGTKAMTNRIVALLRADGLDTRVGTVMSSPDALIAQGLKYAAEGRLQLGPKTETVAQRFFKRIREILGIISTGEQAEALFNKIQDMSVLARAELGDTSSSFVTPRQLSNNAIQRTVAAARQMGDKLAPVLQKTFQTAAERMRATKNPYLQQILREFYITPGTQGASQAMREATNQKTAYYHNQVAEILDGLDQAQKDELGAGMKSGKFSSNPDLAARQKKLQSLLADMREYAVEAGVDLGKRSEGETGYWPWVFEPEAILQDYDGFKKLLLDTMDDDFVRGQIKIRDRKRTVVVGEKQSAAPVTQEQRERTADRVIGAILNAKGYGDSPMIDNYEAANHTPFMGSFDNRILSFIAMGGKHEKYLSNDVDKIMISYIDQTTKRAEFARRFNDDGSKLQQLFDKAESAGLTPAESKLANQFVQAMLGTLGGDINPALRKGMGYVMVYENLRLLSMALFSSLVDPLGIYVRSGSMADATAAFKAGIKEVATFAKRRKGEKDGKTDTRLLAETLGSIEDTIAREALGYEYGGAYMTGTAKQINDKWFEWTGIAGYTRMTRVMATAAAENFLKRHAKGLDKKSERYLAELGLRADDIKFDKQGRLKLLTPEQRREASKRELDRDNRVRNAMYRFIDEAILRPDSAQRPIWASDPHFMLVFHLKGFMYSFYERIMKRAWSEAAEHGNYAPIAALTLYVPGMIGADMIRDAVKDAFGDQDDDHKDEWGMGEWVAHATERSGLYGPYLQQADAAYEDSAYWGKPPGLSMAGPAAEHLYDILTMRGGLDAQLERALPGQNLVRPLWDSLTEE